MSYEELRRLANNARGAWGELMMLLRLSRVYQTSRAVQACLSDIERAKTDLAKAFAAHDAACANLAIHSLPLHNTENAIVERLMKRKENRNGTSRRSQAR